MLLNGHSRALRGHRCPDGGGRVRARWQARRGGGAAHALHMLRAIHSAQATFASSCADGAHAASLNDLATAPKGLPPDLCRRDFSSRPAATPDV